MELAEEFLDRYRKGERPQLREYIDRHPELAAEIKEVFPAMALMENIAVADESVEETRTGKVVRPSEVFLKQLGDYRIIREIGHGGMGVVYEAEQVSLGRHVALKVMPNQALADAKQKRRFEREARAAAKLHHTNIVPVFGVGEHDGVPYYVMQFIQGLGLNAVLDELNRMQPGAAPTPSGLGTAGEIRVARRDVSAADVARSLMTGAFQQPIVDEEVGVPKPPSPFDETLDRPADDGHQDGELSPSNSGSGRLSDSFTVSSSSVTLPGVSGTGRKAAARKQTYWQSVANIGRQVADALEYAHKQGVLHRDVKPSNLLLDMRGTAWVTDFGLAKVAGPGGDNLTHTGDILGTLRYMPPEAFEGKSDARGDVYSLGLTLYELLAMRPAFDEKDRNKLIKQVTTGAPAPLDKVRREVPRDLVTIVQKSIEREPSRRYATAEELATDLQRFLDDEPIQARRQTQVERYVRWARHNPGIATLGGVLTAVLVAATIASLIVAGRMSNLAQKETQAAADERTARHDAEEAKNREAAEKGQAERESKRAETALQKAEENFAKARSAVNDYLTAVSEDERLKAPGLQGLRKQLLESALQFYQEFLQERGNDPALRRELAGIYYKVGEIYRDLGRLPEGRQAYSQAVRLYESLAKESPNDPELQHGLAMALSWTGARTRAISILEKLINPEDAKYQADLGDLYNQEAVLVDNANSDQVKEVEFLRKSLIVRERLVRLRPDDPDARLGLGGSLNNIAIRLTEDHNAEALALIQRSVEQEEAAYRLRPGHLVTARFLTVGLNNVATWAKRLGDSEVVLAAHRRRVEVLDRRARDNPTIAGFDAELVAGYATLLNELRDTGRLDEATRTVDKARVRLSETTEETSEFFRHVVGFHLAAHSVALARVKADPDGEIDTEPEVLAAVNAMRQFALAGWRDANWLRSDPRTEPLRQRADFKELLVRMEELVTADAKDKLTTATAEEKLAARRKILTTLEALAGPPPHARFVRRNIAQARQDWAQALLAAGQVEEARLAFDDALTTRQQLVQESPANDDLRADLAQSQLAAGDLFAAAGKLADAARTWERALATLEESLKKNSNSLALQTTFCLQALHVAHEYAKLGLWDRTEQHYRRVFEVQVATRFATWTNFASLLLGANDVPGLKSLAARAITPLAVEKDYQFISLSRIFLLSDALASLHTQALQQIIERNKIEAQDWGSWCLGFAYVRLGQAEKGLSILEKVKDPLQKLPALAIALRQVGRLEAARDALKQADQQADELLRDSVRADILKMPGNAMDWFFLRMIHREANQAIHGKPMPESPYERLFRGRVLLALGEPGKAEAEFTAAVAARPGDADVWLARSQIFARFGYKDRMADDLLQAQQLKGDDPKTWVETGRMLAERGEHPQADAAFARASVVGKGELNRFLEAGWWVVGPYPEQLDERCPPESNPDPSRPVSAIGDKRELKWQSVSTAPHYGNINLPAQLGGQSKASSYALAYVYADRDRTDALHLWPKNDARVWVNGRLVFAGFGQGKTPGIIEIPITLHRGRNTLLIKNRHDNGASCECAFVDAPVRRGYALMRLGLWGEAAEAFAEGDRSTPLHDYPSRLHIHALFATGRDEEVRKALADMVQRHDQSPTLAVAAADFLPPKKTEDRERRVEACRKSAEADPTDTYRFYRLANACYRAGQFVEAEKNLKKALVNEQLYFLPLVASTFHQLGRNDEAGATLKRMEEKHARLVKNALAAPQFRTAQYWSDEVWYLATRREARMLVLGNDPGPSADETALLTRARARRAELDKAEDAYARLVEEYPNDPRLWIDRGRRLGEIKRGDEAAKAFNKAIELAPKDVQVWRERGRAYAELGKWDEAAADFNKALDLAPAAKVEWGARRQETRNQVVRLKDVFPRIAKLRPTDGQLWIQRVEYLGRIANWAECSQAVDRVVELVPDDYFVRHLQAIVMARAGNVAGYRQASRALMERFGKASSALVWQRVAIACLIAPDAEDLASMLLMMNKQNVTADIKSWYDATLGLAYHRAGQWDQALKVLAPYSRAVGYGEIIAGAVLAMVQHKQNEAETARRTLTQAREAMTRFAAPGLGELQDDWASWLQAELVLREAETLIPAAPMVVSTSGSMAQDYATQRDRKARADSLATRSALAQIRFNVGQKKEAVADLRAVLAEREKIAAEEPSNLDYQFDLSSTRVRLGQFLADSGQIEGALKESQAALAFLEKLGIQQPKNFRVRAEAALVVQAMGDIHAKANRSVDAFKAWKKGIELLDAALTENHGNRTFEAALAKAEEKLGNEYGSLALWPEAGELLARAVRRPGGGTNAWHWARAGQASLAAGNVAEVRKLAAEAFEHFRSSSDPSQLAPFVELMALTDLPKEQLRRMMPLAEQAARENPEVPYLTTLLGMYDYRAYRFAQTIQRLDTPEYRIGGWSTAFLAMAHHGLGQAVKAQEWLSRAEEIYAGSLRKRVEQSAPGVGAIWWLAVNDLIFYREAHELITGKPLPLDPLEHVCRARAYLHLGETAKGEAEFKAAIEARPDDAIIWLARSRAYAKLGRGLEAAADRARALQLAEQALAKHPDDSAGAAVLAGLLLEKLESRWSVLKPLAVKSEGGATLIVQPDNSVLASGLNPDTDVYIIEAEVQGPIGAIRLETIPDPSLPSGGSGRAENGTFILTDVRVSAGESITKWQRAFADYSQAGFPVAFAIDPYKSTGWAVAERQTETHWAVFVPVSPIAGGDKTRLKIRLAFDYKGLQRRNLGHFRLSIVDEFGVNQHSYWFLAAPTPLGKVGTAYLSLGNAKRSVEFLTKALAANPKLAAADWLVLALAHAQLMEADQAKKACSKAADLFKKTGADATLLPLLREVLFAVGTNSAEAKALILAVAGEPPAALNEAVHQNPGEAKGYRDRGNWFGGQGLWKEAIADLAEVFRLEPNSYDAMRLGILLLYTGEIDRYRTHCRAMQERWASTENPGEADHTLKTIVLVPDFHADDKQLMRLAEIAVSGDKNVDWFAWPMGTMGLHDYRIGKYADALAACRESRLRAPKINGDPQPLACLNLAIEAMALYRSGDEAGAKSSLAEAKAIFETHILGIDGEWWHDWLTVHMLYHEAEALLAGKEAKSPK